MAKKSPMSESAKMYFNQSGQYTGYRAPKKNKKPHPVDGSVTRDYSSKPGISIGAAVNSLGKIRNRMRNY